MNAEATANHTRAAGRRLRRLPALGIVGMLLLTACGGSNADTEARAETTTSTAGPDTTLQATEDRAATSGSCTAATPGVSTLTLTSGGNDYDVRVYVPSSFDGATTLPLVLDFHGYSSNGPQQARLSGYEDLAETEGFIVVHPTGIPAQGGDLNSWELTHFGDDPAKDDVAFANDLLDLLIADYCVDETRVYATGMSNGGLFTSRLVCDMSDRLAAAASVSGTTHPDDCDPDRAVPYISYHGTADTVAPFDGSGETVLTEEGVVEEGSNTELFLQVIPEEFGQFAETMGCDPTGTREQLSNDVIATSYRGCDDDVPLTFYEIVDGGHLWPNTPLAEQLGDFRGYITTEIDATVNSWEFFEQHTLATSGMDANPSAATTATTAAPSPPVAPGGDADVTNPPVYDGRLVAADYWDEELRILSAGMGFDGIVGWPDAEFETIRAGGGSYYAEGCAADNPIVGGFPAAFVEAAMRGEADDTPDYDDGLPIVFTWPVLTTTVHPEDFLFTLNNGDQVVPNSAGMLPNYELNERNTIVVFGDFGNRGRVDEPDALYPVSLEIVDDGTPLTFLGPDGPQSGVGLTWEGGTSPYTTGPRLVGAKLNHVGDRPEGEGGVPAIDRLVLPNDEFALYGGGDFRLRMLTSGGFTPTGITGLTPDAYENHFRIHATGADGSTVLLTEVGVDYEVEGGTLRVLGLADLGPSEDQGATYDLCYREDIDNYIDIILIGDEAAARSITYVEVPSEGEYLPLYNPGGPGPTPFPDVRYAAPSPPDLEPVIIALDDPMRVSTP